MFRTSRNSNFRKNKLKKKNKIGQVQKIIDIVYNYSMRTIMKASKEKTKSSSKPGVQILATEVHEGFLRVDEKFITVDEKFLRVDERFDRVDDKFERVDEKFKRVDERFESMQREINIRFDAVLREMDIRFAGVDKRFTSIDQKFHVVYWIMGTGFALVITMLGVIMRLIIL